MSRIILRDKTVSHMLLLLSLRLPIFQQIKNKKNAILTARCTVFSTINEVSIAMKMSHTYGSGFEKINGESSPPKKKMKPRKPTPEST